MTSAKSSSAKFGPITENATQTVVKQTIDVLESGHAEINGTQEAEKVLRVRQSKFALGDQVQHKFFNFRGVVLDIDFTFNHTEEWYNAIPVRMRPRKDQPFYHLLAEKADKTIYFAYVSEQNLIPDMQQNHIDAPELYKMFTGNAQEGWKPKHTVH